MNAAALPAPDARNVRDTRHDRIFRWLLTATAVFVLFTLAAAALSMLWGGRSVLQSEGLSFFTSSDWNPVENKYGALVPIYGTVVTALIAMPLRSPAFAASLAGSTVPTCKTPFVSSGSKPSDAFIR